MGVLGEMTCVGRAASSAQTIGPYRIVEVIGEGGMGIVYRGERAGSPDPVAIKTVRIPHASHLAGIRREILALLQIRHPGIVRVLDEGVEGGLPWYAMELLEGRTLYDDIRATWTPPERRPAASAKRRIGDPRSSGVWSAPPAAASGATAVAASPSIDFTSTTDPEPGARPAGRPLAGGDDLPRVLQVMRELCETLAFLHGEGIIHRDLKPPNIFLRGGVAPVLMDFGIAWRFPAAIGREVLDLAMLQGGTVGYMAPEQIQGEIVDARADLYSVGCILYEVVTGALPFGAGAEGAVVWRQRFTNPTPPSELVEGVSPELGEIILRLLEKRPSDRFGYADDVARALASVGAPRRPGCEPTPARPYVLRPELAGREEAVQELTHLIDRLVDGSGGCALVRGESGIGKTHLAMRLARAALARNLEVITSSCTPVVPGAARGAERGAAPALAESSSDEPLHVFRSLLRTIADRCMERGAELSAALLGDRAKVLAAYEPALARLPGLEGHPAPPELPAKAARDRMLRCMAETIEAFAQKWPLLLVLDDLQWADDRSIELLISLSDGSLRRCPALILGTYRVEQARGRLEELGSTPGITRIDLGELDEESVGAMVSDMLAMSPPPGPFVRFLSHKSEGNPFFVAEYVRAAVAEGLLVRSAAGRWQLPAAVESEGASLEGGPSFGALDRLPLPASLRELCGRRLSNLSPAARALMELASVLGRDVEWDLLSGAASTDDGAALDASRELFTRHILEEAEPGRLRFLHDKLREVAHDQIPAARRASLHGIAARAIEARSAGTADFPLCHAKLARHYIEAGDSDKAMEHLEKAGEHALETSSSREAAGLFRELIAEGAKAGGHRPSEHDLMKWARWERRLAEACYGIGDFAAAEEHAGRALSWAGYPLPRSRPAWVLRLLREIPVQIAHRIAPGSRGAMGAAERAGAIEASIALEGLGKVYFRADALRAITAGLWSMSLAERAGGGAKLASAYAVLGTVLGFCQLPRLARVYFTLARDTAEETKDEAGAVISLYSQAFWLVSRGRDWDAIRAICREAGERARRLGDRNEVDYVETIRGITEFLSGHLQESERHLEAAARGAAERANWQQFAASTTLHACALFRLGKIAQAEARLEQSRPALERGVNNFVTTSRLGLLAALHACKGEIDRAIELADLVSAHIDEIPVLMGLSMACGGAAEAYLAQLESPSTSSPAEIARARAGLRRILTRLYFSSQVHPIDGPLYRHLRGRSHWLEGAFARAKRSWERGLAASVELDALYDQAIAHVDLARCEPPGSAARAGHLDLAESLAAQLGYRPVLAEVDALRG